MQFQEFALKTIIFERNFKNDTIKRRTFQHTGPSSCIKSCSEKLHQLIDIKMMKRNCAAYGSYYNVSTQSFLWRKLFHRGSQAFIFLPEKCFNHIVKVWILAVTRFYRKHFSMSWPLTPLMVASFESDRHNPSLCWTH